MSKKLKITMTFFSLLVAAIVFGYVIYKTQMDDDEIIEISDDDSSKEDNKVKKKVYKKETYTAKDFITKPKTTVAKIKEIEKKDNKDDVENSKFVKDILKKYNSQPESKYIDKMLDQTINFMYKDFFEQENLDPETKEAVTKNILNTMKLQSTILKKAMTKDADIDAILEEQEKMRKHQEKELAEQFPDEQQHSDFKEYRDGVFNKIITDKVTKQSEGLGFSPDLIDKLRENALKHSSSSGETITKPLTQDRKSLLNYGGNYMENQNKDLRKGCESDAKLIREAGESSNLKGYLGQNPFCQRYIKDIKNDDN
jgi:hypothetical protein